LGSRLEVPREELRSLHREYRATSDPERKERIRERLVEGYRSLVYFLARKFINRGEPLEDIVQVGFLGLIKAIERFDPELGNEFTTFATPTVTGEIKRYFRDKGWAIRFPRRLQELYQQVLRANEELKRDLGRTPRVAEIAERLKVSEEEVLEAMEMSPAKAPRSLDAPVSSDSQDDGRSLSDAIGNVDTNLDRVEMRDVLRRAMEHLTPRERSIMAMRFYDEMSQSEIAKRLGISQMHVSRLQRAALDHLREVVPQEAGS
jgi:RNA polymerase sigma-B factor